MNPAALDVAIVGAGWAGCAAAVELTLRGHRVHLVEAARALGGRARGLRQTPASAAADAWEENLDNGQHILLGAYQETLRLMRVVGVDTKKTLLRLPLQMRYPAGCGGIDFLTVHLPAPLHLLVGLLRTTALTRADKLALARFTTTARWIDWRLNQDCSVTELLERFDQTERVTQLLWRPLCLAALNTPPQKASAQVLLNVLRDSLGARRASSDMLIPRINLGPLFPQPAVRFITERGARLTLGARVTALVREHGRWQLTYGAGHANGYDAVVLATPLAETARLEAGVTAIDTVVAAAEDVTADVAPSAFTYEPIITCYLQYAPSQRLPLALHALIDDASRDCWGQFVFDRGYLDVSQAGLLAVVVSAASAAVALDHARLAAAIAAQLAAVFSDPPLQHPLRTKIIVEKRATFSCTPGLIRPASTTAYAGLLRAGDYVASDYPATIEAAVQSGVRAARLVDSTLGKRT